MTAVDGLGYLAAALVLATFCAKRMLPLRALAIASNIAFVAYGFFCRPLANPPVALGDAADECHPLARSPRVAKSNRARSTAEFAPDFGGRQTTPVSNGTRGAARTSLIT